MMQEYNEVVCCGSSSTGHNAQRESQAVGMREANGPRRRAALPGALGISTGSCGGTTTSTTMAKIQEGDVQNEQVERRGSRTCCGREAPQSPGALLTDTSHYPEGRLTGLPNDGHERCTDCFVQSMREWIADPWFELRHVRKPRLHWAVPEKQQRPIRQPRIWQPWPANRMRTTTGDRKRTTCAHKRLPPSPLQIEVLCRCPVLERNPGVLRATMFVIGTPRARRNGDLGGDTARPHLTASDRVGGHAGRNHGQLRCQRTREVCGFAPGLCSGRGTKTGLPKKTPQPQHENGEKEGSCMSNRLEGCAFARYQAPRPRNSPQRVHR